MEGCEDTLDTSSTNKRCRLILIYYSHLFRMIHIPMSEFNGFALGGYPYNNEPKKIDYEELEWSMRMKEISMFPL
ncbi:hypothetical protein DdX_17210 [Ditylenchus destructor]|uniref:Uncharacterized protein n=1 Tax=Ditylenchus destructor TaxID=166010 RepID=A0AAD4MMR1_9BILA|nr:hypothetical protein DdX_17210 [Ditylenchus destructor]